MEQLSFTDLEAGLRCKTRKTHVERLTERLEELVPWTALQDLIRPLYYPPGRRGRQQFPLDLMLRIHLLQVAYNLSDPRMEDLLLENSTARKFVGLNLMDRTPDESTILQFRHLFEKHELGAKILETINKQFLEAGLKLSTGRIVDASFIEAPNSTKNKEHKRDPEMASGKKGNVWHFGMKMHIGTDGRRDRHERRLRARQRARHRQSPRGDPSGDGSRVRRRGIPGHGEARGVPDRQRVGEPRLQDHDIARRGEHLKSSVRCKVEHVFARVKLRMGYRKTRYRGIAKNANRINTLLGLSNLFTMECWARRTMG